ncbi:FAD-dependent oxidoreductase [Bailinhaonella thermotolerans]|uniref:FAD-dependent oxidoreductase n=1 Tax=Bailinhaonella thermotolerans TaxID=1070861 RepID=A0A3A4BWC1_9ACTN|nr:FAD-dependent oxidoreductase [Bailinhaonella thermotolerans]RJL35888.1 FAD-dependent oxidoreductase [Bailinhaonella thermotolerans]
MNEAEPDRTPGVDVLVAGAGPAGLVAAHELARRGVRVRVVDKAEGPATTSRATATHARTLELYHQMGFVGDILARGLRCEHFTMHRGGRRLIRLDTEYSTLPTRYPFTLQIDQVLTEEVLRNRLRGLGVEVEWGVALANLDGAHDRVRVRLRGGDGTAEDIRVPWLIGADGGHSRVRSLLGLPLVGDASETWLIADAVLDADLPRDSLHWIHVGKGPILLVPFPEPGRWRLLDTVDVTGADDPHLIASRFAAKLTEGLGRPVEVGPPSWVSVFTIQQRMVRRMRAGRCFVVGDAAHVHSPASGQGLNVGVHDAYNLAWKLADVIRGHARDTLLDTFPAERLPVGATLLRTTRTATALIALRDAAPAALLPLGLGLLNAVGPLKRRVERKLLSAMSGLALTYAGSPLTLDAGTAHGGWIRPGKRVACSAETERDCPAWSAVLTELTDPRWSLLVFAGDAPAAPLRAALRRVEIAYGRAVSVRTVSRTGRGGPAPLADPGAGLSQAFGLRPGDYALIRPDGYLAAAGRFEDPARMADILAALHLVPAPRTGPLLTRA